MKNIQLGIAIVSLTLLLSGCGGAKDSKASGNIDNPVAVSTAKVTKMSVESDVVLNGRVKPIQEVNIVTKTPGKVESINFDVGQAVKKDDVLFTLEQKDIQLQVNQSKASYDMAAAALDKLKGGAADQQLSQLKSALVSAEVNYNDAKLNLERTKQLAQSGAVSQQALEAAESKLKIAEDQYNSSKLSYEVTRNKINPGNLASAEAQVKQAQASLDLAKSQLENTIIKAPFGGIIGSKNIRVGELLGNSTVAMSIVDLSSVTVEVNVPENMINNIKLDDNVKVTISAAASEQLEGKVISISPNADSKLQSYPVKIAIKNEQQAIKGGMLAEIRFAGEKARNTLAIPLSSVIDEGGSKFVYILNGDTVQKKNVTIGVHNDKLVQIIDGLKENDVIITKGQSFLTDGSKVIETDN